MNRETLQQQLQQGMQQLELAASPQQVQQLLDYLLLLQKWNKAYNLTAIREPDAMVTRHLLDSLALLPHIGDQGLLDVGSGAGLPGIPLAIMKPGLAVDSLDSNGKKIRFQFQVKTALGLDNLSLHQHRVEAYQPASLSRQLVSRAFASLKDFLGWTDHLAAADARWFAMKGQFPVQELEELPKKFTLEASHPLVIPGVEEQRHLLLLKRVEAGSR